MLCMKKYITRLPTALFRASLCILLDPVGSKAGELGPEHAPPCPASPSFSSTLAGSLRSAAYKPAKVGGAGFFWRLRPSVAMDGQWVCSFRGFLFPGVWSGDLGPTAAAELQEGPCAQQQQQYQTPPPRWPPLFLSPLTCLLCPAADGTDGKEGASFKGGGDQGVHRQPAQEAALHQLQEACSPRYQGDQGLCLQDDGHQGCPHRRQPEQGRLEAGREERAQPCAHRHQQEAQRR